MWFVGLVCGLVLGLMFGGALHGWPGALAGGFVGALLGVFAGRAIAGSAPAAAAGRSGRSADDRLRTLEVQVDWLYRESQALRQELAVLRGEAPAVDAPPSTPAPTAAASESVADAPAAPGAEFSREASPEPATAPTADSAARPNLDYRPEGAAASADDDALAAPPTLWSRLMAGNPLAKIGVVMLFFGVASALKLAADYGLFPPSLRLLLAAVAGVAMIAFGFLKARPDEGAASEGAAGEAGHRTFGLALQGGGFALLYLVVYFMLDRYAMIGHGPAFILFGVLGVCCVLLAARQDGPALAVLGLSGAFLAPVMAGGHSATPLPLFAYFALLNAFILAVDWFRAWRVLNIAGFLFTLAIGMAWTISGYRPEHYAVTQGFLILFLLMYSATPVLTALLRAPGGAAWREGMLIFGTPLVGGFLQTPLVRGFDHGLAWSTFIAAIYYFGLWALMFRRGSDEVRILERGHLGIALALLTLTVPLAFDAQVTSAFWAAEGAAVLWFGVRQQRLLAQTTGLLMQLAAAAAFAHGWQHLGHEVPILNDVALGGLLIAAAGLVCARLLHRLEGDDAGLGLPPALPYLWALAWWFGVGFAEIGHFAEYVMRAPFALVFTTLTVLGLEVLGVVWRWPLLRQTAILLLPALWIGAAFGVDRGGHPLAGLMLLALPLAFVVHYALLARHERAAASAAMSAVGGRLVRHLGAWWLAILVVTLELGWLAQRLAPGVSLWPLLAWGLAPALGLALAAFALRRDVWPWAAAPDAYRGLGAWPPALAVALWSLGANLTHAGGGSGLPYLPLLNFFDLVQLAALAALVASVGRGDAATAVFFRRVAGGLAFVWLTTLAARIAHHWGDVPFAPGYLMDSSLCQALVTLLWTLTAIAAMIQAARARLRPRWFAGFGLLAVVGAKLLMIDLANAGTVIWTGSLIGVALLVLAASYFAPVPPRD